MLLEKFKRWVNHLFGYRGDYNMDEMTLEIEMFYNNYIKGYNDDFFYDGDAFIEYTMPAFIKLIKDLKIVE